MTIPLTSKSALPLGWWTISSGHGRACLQDRNGDPPGAPQSGANRGQRRSALQDTADMANANLSNIGLLSPRGAAMVCAACSTCPYFQDEWKATPTLTLTAGVRWEYYGVAHEATNRTTVFDLNEFHGVCLGSGSFNTPSRAAKRGPIDTAPCPKDPDLYNPDYRNIDPSWIWPGRRARFTVKLCFEPGLDLSRRGSERRL